jgi:hypothetical protein
MLTFVNYYVSHRGVLAQVDLLLVKEFGDNTVDTSANGFELLSTLPHAN